VSSRRTAAQGVDNAVLLATEQWRARFRTERLNLLPPFELNNEQIVVTGSREHQKKNTLACLHRQDTFAYIGPWGSLNALISEPLLNRAGMLEISPENTDPGLTNPRLRSLLQPATFRHRLSYLTYYRVITTDATQGPEDTAYLREKLHAATYFVVDDASSYGRGLVQSAQAYGAKVGLRLLGAAHVEGSSASAIASSADAASDIVLSRHPDGVFFGGFPPQAVEFAQDLRRKGYSGPLVGGDGLYGAEFPELAGYGTVNIYASQEIFDPAAAPKSFRQAYQRRFHVPLQLLEPLAYDAANVALHATYLAATHGAMRGGLFQMRASVLPYVARVHWHGATGITSFDRNGDTRNQILSIYAVRGGGWVFAGLSPKVRGVSPSG
jgi:branched-chain amino acid transport system substrate-binding protein